MAVFRYISHTNVVIDPLVPVGKWGLSDEGRRRAEAMCDQPWIAQVGRIVCSDETKAVETAAILSAATGVDAEVREGVGENDRSGTGFVPPDEFEVLADAFFANPEVSVSGWERAVDAQARIVAGVADVLEDSEVGDVAAVGHGGVGTLLYCHLRGIPIDRQHDQPGQGYYFAVDLPSLEVLHGWRAVDDLEDDDSESLGSDDR